jgi:osmotically-inducible protein OsmY
MKTDAEIQKDVMEELKWDPSVTEAGIGVSAKDGVVTLSGYVENYPQKWAAEDAAARVSGVKAVVEEIKVRLPGTYERTDQDIAAAAVNALNWNVSVPKDKVKIGVQEGWVTLNGNVDWQYQKDAAFDAICCMMGVVGVTNDISVEPRVKAMDIKTKIEGAFQRHAALEGRKITVEARGDKVILSGTVHSQFEKQEAEDAAWAAPGVTQVEDKILVMP